jgi:hypothetical protein
VGSEEDDRSTGKTGRRDYHAHGVSLCQDAVGGTSTSLQLLAPYCPPFSPFFDCIEKVPKVPEFVLRKPVRYKDLRGNCPHDPRPPGYRINPLLGKGFGPILDHLGLSDTSSPTRG